MLMYVYIGTFQLKYQYIITNGKEILNSGTFNSNTFVDEVCNIAKKENGIDKIFIKGAKKYCSKFKEEFEKKQNLHLFNKNIEMEIID